MTITLDDVSQILDVPITGDGIHGGLGSMTSDSCVELLVKCLGISEVDANEEIVDVYSFRLDWIKQHCQGAPADAFV